VLVCWMVIGVGCVVVNIIIRFDVFTPHVLSEGCLEWCSFICVVFGVIVRYSTVFHTNPKRIGVCASVLGYYYIIIYYYIIHYYYILYYYYYYSILYITVILLLYTYTLLFLIYLPSSLSPSHPLIYSPLSIHSPPSFILYLSILIYTYLYSIHPHLPHLPHLTILTPHVLSEGMEG
jgi:hypothetical protein